MTPHGTAKTPPPICQPTCPARGKTALAPPGGTRDSDSQSGGRGGQSQEMSLWHVRPPLSFTLQGTCFRTSFDWSPCGRGF